MKRKMNKVKLARKLSRAARIPPARVMVPAKDRRRRSRSGWKEELAEQLEDGRERRGEGAGGRLEQ